jgi:hypothetical protein
MADPNAITLAWTAVCDRRAKLTRLEPIPSRRLLPVFPRWPSRTAEAGDAEAAAVALAEPGPRIPYKDLRRSLLD